ncbi:hypothetical protein KFL_001660180 [Klebsormidium nitens]|uniref:Uncharacterized protein n=1 Tax=Klebsormidium nitens TaxID=105231 RepID=A0A1Y1I0B1_KLENI|nr:hypothetical protein KFL_001660180 [Klebsormidium nitens]|eukprot:GAQ83883.1 hypothetical protein KFL_001660180 [Klebsormidium nitens]
MYSVYGGASRTVQDWAARKVNRGLEFQCFNAPGTASLCCPGQCPQNPGPNPVCGPTLAPAPTFAQCDPTSATPNQCFNAAGSQSICCPGQCPGNPGATAVCGGLSPATGSPGNPSPTSASGSTTGGSPPCDPTSNLPNQCFNAAGSQSICCPGQCPGNPGATAVCGGPSPATGSPGNPSPTSASGSTTGGSPPCDPMSNLPNQCFNAAGSQSICCPGQCPGNPGASAVCGGPSPATGSPGNPSPTSASGSTTGGSPPCNPTSNLPNQCFNAPGTASICCPGQCPNNPGPTPFCA